MTGMNNRLSQLSDPMLDAFSDLLVGGASIVEAAVSAAGVSVSNVVPRQTTWQPGRSLTVRYDAVVDGTHPESFVATTDKVDGAVQMSGPSGNISVWAGVSDPLLPGLRVVMTGNEAAELLDSIGASRVIDSTLVAYRPGRRAVVRIRTAQGSLFAKIVRPGKARKLHEMHNALASRLPVPPSLGYSDEFGIVVMPELHGQTLRSAVAQNAAPSANQLLDLLEEIPDIGRADSAPWRAAEFANLLVRLVPEVKDQINELVEGLNKAEGLAPTANRTVHGDFHEAQVLVDNGAITGLLDVDTLRRGSQVDDLANMLGHMSVMSTIDLSGHYRAYVDHALEAFDQVVEPALLRQRTAAVVLGLATGSFRVLDNNWYSATQERIELASQWFKSARNVNEKDLILG